MSETEPAIAPEVQAQLDSLIRLSKFTFEDAVTHWESNVEFKNHFQNLLSGMIHAAFVESKGINYVEMQMEGPDGGYVVTIQRRQGRTPHELRREAEAELARLRAKFEGAKADG